MTTIAQTASVAPNAELDASVVVGDFCVLGTAPATPGGGASAEFGPLRAGDSCLFRTHTVVYAGTVIGERFQSGHHVLIREECRFGNDVSIGSGSIVEHHVLMGDNVRLHSNCFVPEFTILETGAWLGPGVIMTNSIYPMSAGSKERLSGSIVGENAKIGAGAIVLPGIRIGKGALIGAGAVVTRDVPKHTVVAGNPARVRRKVWDLTNEDGSRAYPGQDTVF